VFQFIASVEVLITVPLIPVPPTAIKIPLPKTIPFI
jgi:hypothetical protein